MTVNAARLLRDQDAVFVGVGLPNLACNLARRTHAPNLVMIYESGVIGAQPARLPLSIGDPTLVSGALAVCSMYDIFAYYLQRGYISVGFMGGAQIDRFGNINATVIGDYRHPKVRLPGSGGSMEIAAWADRCYLLAPHQKRRFPEKCDFRTSAGFLDGRAAREAMRLRGGGRPRLSPIWASSSPMRPANWSCPPSIPASTRNRHAPTLDGTCGSPLTCGQRKPPARWNCRSCETSTPTASTSMREHRKDTHHRER
jgi:acyl CoA:acetate/3-ketoacid CoA transferase beta subunit